MFDWTLQTAELLRQLLNVLSENIKTWERFASANGDIGYFSDIDCSVGISQSHPLRSLHAIKETFETLEGLQHKLLRLEKSCQNSAQAVSHSPLMSTIILAPENTPADRYSSNYA
jgi:hypothetical protein